MTDLGASRARGRAPGWSTIVAANVAGGIPSILGAMYVSAWLQDVFGDAPYSSDPDVAIRVGQIAAVLMAAGFIGGNLWLRSVCSCWRPWVWLVALGAAALPSLLVWAQHALFYGPGA